MRVISNGAAGGTFYQGRVSGWANGLGRNEPGVALEWFPLRCDPPLPEDNLDLTLP